MWDRLGFNREKSTVGHNLDDFRKYNLINFSVSLQMQVNKDSITQLILQRYIIVKLYCKELVKFGERTLFIQKITFLNLYLNLLFWDKDQNYKTRIPMIFSSGYSYQFSIFSLVETRIEGNGVVTYFLACQQGSSSQVSGKTPNFKAENNFIITLHISVSSVQYVWFLPPASTELQRSLTSSWN